MVDIGLTRLSVDIRVTTPFGKRDCGLAGLGCPRSFLHSGHGHRNRRNGMALWWSSSLRAGLTPKGTSLGALQQVGAREPWGPGGAKQ